VALLLFQHLFFMQFFMTLRAVLEKSKKLQQAREIHDAKVPVLKLQIDGVEVHTTTPPLQAIF